MVVQSQQQPPVVRRSVDELLLDPENPRLPEDVRGGSQSEILVWLYGNEVLEEIAQSIVDNGFFPHEPIIVLEGPRGPIVVEGNRRLATLTILLQLPAAVEAEIEFDIEGIDDALRASIREIPCWATPNREEVRRFLGFRHIGGIRKWSPEAKARFLADEIAHQVQQGTTDPFREVGRQVGSNAQGVRNPYLALTLLRHARAEYGIKTQHIIDHRFGVWNRCMNAKDLRDYIGLGSPRTYAEVVKSVAELSGDRLAEVIADLTPTPGSKRAVVADSREVTIYSQILVNEEAHKVLRQYGDLLLAAQVITDASLPTRVANLVDLMDLIIKDAYSVPNPSAVIPPTEALGTRVQTLRSILTSLTQDGPNA